jgi:subtilisin
MSKKYSLLPYVREDIYGLTPDIAQVYGWEIQKFHIPKYWKQSQGEGVKVAVIDTGCDINHKDLRNNILEGKNFVQSKEDPIDRNGHGSHVAGTIAASNNQTGMVGVAPLAKIVPVKALNDDGSGRLDHIVKAIEWSANYGVDFITMSLGSPQPSSELQSVIKYASEKGCIIFCAAGNDGTEHDILYPAKYDHTIAIGAIDRNFERTTFTCSGEQLDFLAPGHEIFSCVPGDSYAIMSGTSMSNPFAVGCAALLLSYARKTGSESKLKTYQDYINIFSKNTSNLQNPEYAGKRKYQGFGIIHPIEKF